MTHRPTTHNSMAKATGAVAGGFVSSTPQTPAVAKGRTVATAQQGRGAQVQRKAAICAACRTGSFVMTLLGFKCHWCGGWRCDVVDAPVPYWPHEVKR